jgi:hypothetical protein
VKPGNHAATFIAPDATTWRRAMTSPQNEKPLIRKWTLTRQVAGLPV